jgi:hypothetical protein
MIFGYDKRLFNCFYLLRYDDFFIFVQGAAADRTRVKRCVNNPVNLFRGEGSPIMLLTAGLSADFSLVSAAFFCGGGFRFYYVGRRRL